MKNEKTKLFEEYKKEIEYQRNESIEELQKMAKEIPYTNKEADQD